MPVSGRNPNSSFLPVQATHHFIMTTPAWLVSYNALSSIAWFSVLVLATSYPEAQPQFFQDTQAYVRLVQTFAIVEVYNSLVGNVRSPVFTTAVQVASRLLVVWGVFYVLPNSPANTHWAYITLCLSWSITEIIRYGYYALNIVTEGNPPKFLTWLRYNTFLVLYPTGVGSEVTILFKSLDEAERVVGAWYKYLFIAILATYIPGFYMLFSYMLKQRGKTLKKLSPKKEK
ncbi:3-hydroxyacyl-CoA dehydratase [Komagataella phaffii GS115]|uniref:Very-long-chain (3R)-3-hydroxyacyl-CoA dehydratase n=2 Tax=Komagataella phaffii TaxID=460519 RepID=C4R3W7_KOMPG|nr:3-hydroxyacyl-CoA dehydratase [Komagataella phaffii GS115]CAY70228.1 3-hydroxyacyl-CoA dehydratase [Komagataella phaffii GS115]